MNRRTHLGTYLALALASGLCLVSAPSEAFQLGDHERITRLAADEMGFCRGAALPGAFVDKLVRANLDEDLNFARKWTSYSHFYNPNKNLTDQRRFDSSIRIVELDHQISELIQKKGAKGLEEAYSLLGHAIHLLQDSASPPHVVPVMHGLSDGFESFELSAEEGPDLDYIPENCRVKTVPRSATQIGLLGLLSDSAQLTLDALKKERFTVALQKGSVTSDWSAFWLESPENKFGTYGALGNVFGQSSLATSKGPARIDVEVYKSFKRARMRAAMTVTHQALLWLQNLPW